MKRISGISFLIGALAGIALLVGLAVNRDVVLRAWLFGWYFWFGVTMGCLAILLLQYIIHSEWGFVIRRQLEAGVFTLPAMAVLFIPVLAGIKSVYEWAAMGVDTHDPTYCFKCFWLDIPFFIVRAAIYFGVFLAIAMPLLAWSRRDDEQEAAARDAKLNALGAGGLIAYFFVFTLAAIDWIMSLEPNWHSTIFGAQLIMGHGISGVSAIVLATVWLRRSGPLRDVIRTRHINDLGNIMLAFVMLWTYMAFMQYLIIWNGNLREDNVWYADRGLGWWPALAALLAIVHFAIPFAILLSRTAKRNAQIMAGVATLLLAAHAADCFWLIAPNFDGARGRLGWMDIAALIAIGGLWIGFFMRRLAGAPLVPRHDVRYEAVSRAAVEEHA